MRQKPKSSQPSGKGFTLLPLPEESKESPIDGEADSREPFDQLGELPHGYGVDTIFLIAQEPHWLFTYWDIDIARHPGGAAYLRHHLADGTLEGEIEVPFETRNWYVPVERSGADYFVEIGFYRGDIWNLIARSVAVTTPPEGMAASEAFDYATIPFHLSFQRMLDHLETARDSGEDLLAAVSRLQRDGDFSAFGTGGISDLLTEDQRALLQALLGAGFLATLASSGQSSREIEAQIRLFLEAQINSGGGGSEFLNSFRDTTALFSGGALSSASATGSAFWEIGALSSWAAGALTSWAASGSEQELASWGGVTSWSASESAGASGAIALGGAAGWAGSLGGSWTHAALTSWAQAITSSWLAGAGSSGGMAGSLSSWSSWLQSAQTSWAGAALGSWDSAEVSSWFSATETSSWSGASETLSSFGSGTAASLP